MDRFSLKEGKFGHYFRDVKEDRDLSLKEVLLCLNQPEHARLVGRHVTVYDRYRFAVPVKGRILEVNPHDGSYKIDFFEGQHGGSNVTKFNGSYFFKEQCNLCGDL